jgi:hypothetical protein
MCQLSTGSTVDCCLHEVFLQIGYSVSVILMCTVVIEFVSMVFTDVYFEPIVR